MSKRVWSTEEKELMKIVYPNLSNAEIQTIHFPNKTVQQITGFANKNGIFKTEEFLAQQKLKNALNGLSYIGDQKGIKSPRWVDRINTSCDNCNKTLHLTESDYRKSEKHFCDLECMGRWKSKNLIGENNPNFGNSEAWTEEKRRDRAELSVKIVQSQNKNKSRTKPEEIIFQMLNNMGECNVEQYSCKYYIVDFYLPQHHLMIEVQGNFFHCNPTMNLNNSRQEKIIRKDKSKHTYIKKYHEIEILYLWEKDIVKHTELCKLLIDLYIDNKGVLNNYHSFNYEINNNKTIQLLNNLVSFDY